MKKQKNTKVPTQKKQNTIWVVIVSMFIGFLGGVAFTVYKSNPDRVPQPQKAEKNQQKENDNPIVAAEIEMLEKKLDRNPEDTQILAQLGNYYFDTNNFKKAIEAYSKYLEIDPENTNIIVDLGVMYRRSGRPIEAVKAFNLAIEKDPNHEIALFNKGVVLMHDLKDTKAAIKSWEELVEKNPAAVAPSGQLVKELLQSIKENT